MLITTEDYLIWDCFVNADHDDTSQDLKILNQDHGENFMFFLLITTKDYHIQGCFVNADHDLTSQPGSRFFLLITTVDYHIWGCFVYG